MSNLQTIFKILLIVFGFLVLLALINQSHAQEYLSDEYSYPNGGVPPPEVVPAPSQTTRGLDDSDYGYTDNMGWHSYPHGTPDPGGNCWASFRC